MEINGIEGILRNVNQPNGTKILDISSILGVGCRKDKNKLSIEQFIRNMKFSCMSEFILLSKAVELPIKTSERNYNLENVIRAGHSSAFENQ